MATVTKTATLIPSGNTGLTSLTTSSSYPVSNGYKASGDTSNYARFTLSTSTEGHLYYKFDTSQIPAGATITSVSASVTVRVNSTTRGATQKGSSVTFASTTASNTITLTTNTTLYRSDLNDLRILIGATGSSSTSSKYIYFYGATMTITYTVAMHNITISNSTSATVTASESSVADGDSVEIYTDTISGITIKDNGTDITSQFAARTGATISSVPGSYDTGGSINGTNYKSTIGKGSNTSNRTGNDYFSTSQGGSGSTWIDYFFDFSTIPSDATIDSVSVTVKGHCESTTESREISRVQAYSGTTAKGSYTDMTDSTTDKVYTMSVGTWTATELHSAKLRYTIGVYGGLVSGATWTVTYTVSGYVYTITNVSTDHTIVVTESGGTEAIYYKANGSWVQATTVYKKVNGSWVQQSDLTNVFDANTNYVKG